MVTAQGQLPYPDGTQLLIRVLAGTGADAPLRLQTLQATPPAAPAILAPLRQSEADALAAALDQPDPPPALSDLAGLARMLGPDVQLQAAVDTLPAPSLAALKSVLDLAPETSTAALVSALDTWLASAPAPSGARQTLVTDLLQRFQASVERHPEVAPAQGENLVQWLKQVLGANERPATPTAPVRSDTPAQVLQQQLGGRTGDPQDVPATWEAWIRTSIKALNDPSVSPQGAPFHAAQAKEGTAFYELPLPWAPQHPLQMWVESDRDPKDQDPSRPETQRVLLGLSFSNLGETRLGIVKSAAGLQVRVWAEHPELLAASKAAVEAELQDLGSSVDLKIMPLAPGPGGTIPSFRSQVAGAGLEGPGLIRREPGLPVPAGAGWVQFPHVEDVAHPPPRGRTGGMQVPGGPHGPIQERQSPWNRIGSGSHRNSTSARRSGT